ncbi:MAG: hypothetical protein Q8O84_00790, partial [Nanoarchaeota archaeon]|nr:hypothetical protein [Nanoarchaeota archaeon]
MKDILSGEDKIQKICDTIKKETLDPAKEHAHEIIENAQIESKEIINKANKEKEKIINDAKKQIEKEYSKKIEEVAGRAKEMKVVAGQKDEKIKVLEEEFKSVESDLKDIKPLTILSENQYQELSLRFGHLFEAGIGAEAIRSLLEKINLEKTIEAIGEEIKVSKGAKCERLIRRAKLLKSFYKNNIKPEWMVLDAIPVIPPDLRPMVALDGGRFATSDLNDLYRRVINRNNRLKRLLDLNAPEVICRHEKRMLQEAVDALIDNNARASKTVTASTG